ncbi:MAG: hypothetical protein RLZZ584_1492 [Pseudomonadota bacterium]
MAAAKLYDWKPAREHLHDIGCPLCGVRKLVELAGTDRYDMDLVTVGCSGCGFVFTNPQPSAELMNEFYRNHYRRFYQGVGVPSVEYIRQYKKDVRGAYVAQFLRTHGVLGDGAAVLDVGGSEGAILAAIAAVAPAVQRYLIEPNEEFGRFAETYAGCTWWPDLQALRAQGRQASVVILNHVYEHVPDPVGYLRDIATVMTEGAALYIDVPDIEAYRRLDALHIAHLTHFSVRTLRLAIELAGFEVVLVEPHQPVNHPASIRCLARRTGSAAPAPAPSNGREGWARLQQCDRQAWRYHRRRWSLVRRLGHLLKARPAP